MRLLALGLAGVLATVFDGGLFTAGLPALAKTRVASKTLERSQDVSDTIDIWKRDNMPATVLELNYTNGVYYNAKITVGTPAQNINVLVDTRSADLVLLAGDNTCQITGSNNTEDIYCQPDVYFNYNQSSTFHQNNTYTSQVRPDGRGDTMSVLWGTDYVGMAGFNVSNSTLAIALDSGYASSTLGLGLRAAEGTVTTYNNGRPSPVYDNLPILLKEYGLISSVSFSLWLDETSGSLAFGNIDLGRVEPGTLQTVPVVESLAAKSLKTSVPIDFSVMLHSLTIGSSITVNFSVPAALDSTVPGLSGPSTIINAISEGIGATWSESLDTWVAPCSTNESIVFNLSGIEVNVPSTSILTTWVAGNTTDPKLCTLNLDQSADVVLGTAFLRETYVVFDADLLEVTIGRPNKYATNTTYPQLEAIGSSVPGAIRAPGYSSTSLDTSYKVTTLAALPSQATVPQSFSQSWSLENAPSSPRYSTRSAASTGSGTSTKSISSRTSNGAISILHNGPIGLLSILLYVI